MRVTMDYIRKHYRTRSGGHLTRKQVELLEAEGDKWVERHVARFLHQVLRIIAATEGAAAAAVASAAAPCGNSRCRQCRRHRAQAALPAAGLFSYGTLHCPSRD